MERLVVGIAGGTGSGKTTLAKRIMQAFANDGVLLSHDFYYKDNKEMSFEERVVQNYDHPDSLDTDMMAEHIIKLKNGETIMHPTYNFETHLRNDEWVETHSAKIIVVEGILLFESERLRNIMDIKIYVDTDDDVRFIRRLKRDVKNRGRSMDSVINQYLSTVKPMHQQFVEPSRRKADIIIPEGGHNKIAVGIIIDAINKKMFSE